MRPRRPAQALPPVCLAHPACSGDRARSPGVRLSPVSSAEIAATTACRWACRRVFGQPHADPGCPWSGRAADHQELAGFYARLLDGTLLWVHDKAAAVEAGGVVLVMQRSEDYRPPVWPGTSIVHLDLNGDAPVGELARRAVALGAQLVPAQPDLRWRVLLDPAGHPFCITPFTP